MREQVDDAKLALMKLRGYPSMRFAETEYEHIVEGQRGATALSIRELVTNRDFRKPLIIALLLQVIQQVFQSSFFLLRVCASSHPFFLFFPPRD